MSRELFVHEQMEMSMWSESQEHSETALKRWLQLGRDDDKTEELREREREQEI